MIQDHPIRSADIHSNVHFVCKRLHEDGHTALLVGGAVRDLLLGRAPKDFDLATSARPEAVKQLFRNARIIGRRFKLVQLRYPSMAMEVATFRGEPRAKRQGAIQRDNRYGTSEEDAKRRDFTINALTFDPLSLTLYDYVGGMEDLRARRIRTIKPPQVSYREDPVRMLRAVRFKVRLGFTIDPHCEAAIGPLAPLLGEVTRHRLAEEMQRFLTRGNAEDTYREFERLELLRPLLGMEPHARIFSQEALKRPWQCLERHLRRMDAWVAQGGEQMAPTVALLGLLITLGREEPRAWVNGDEGAAATAFERSFRGTLRDTLGLWGLLNGQVAPALHILDAARLLAQRGEALLRDPAAAAAVAGIREAVLLRAILLDPEQANDPTVAHSVTAWLARLPHLPDLPILDHPRPLRRAAADRSAQSRVAPVGQDRPRRGSRRRSEGRRGGHRKTPGLQLV